MKKIIPLITCEITFGQYVYELMCGVDVPNLNLTVQVDSVKRTFPTLSNVRYNLLQH